MYTIVWLGKNKRSKTYICTCCVVGTLASAHSTALCALLHLSTLHTFIVTWFTQFVDQSSILSKKSRNEHKRIATVSLYVYNQNRKSRFFFFAYLIILGLAIHHWVCYDQSRSSQARASPKKLDDYMWFSKLTLWEVRHLRLCVLWKCTRLPAISFFFFSAWKKMSGGMF